MDSCEDYASWLGASPDADAAQTIAALKAEKPEWLVVDHYGIGSQWERQVRPQVGRILVVDDLANRPHECDALLDQNYSPLGDARYAGLVTGACKVLTGSRYALLAPEYAHFRRALRPRRDPPERVLLFFGGSDPMNATAMALEALSRDGLRGLKVDIVLGRNYAHRAALHRLVEARPGTKVFEPQRHLAGFMAQADLAIGAGGSTTWERMCLALPTVLVSIAENQKPASEALRAAGLAYYAGHWPGINANLLAELVLRITRDAGALSRLGERIRTHVDGLGAGRVAEVMLPSRFEESRLRPDTEHDNSCAGGDASRSPGTQLLLESGNVPLGWMHGKPDGDAVLIDWALDPIVQGRDWDARFVARGASMMCDVEQGNPVYVGKRSRIPTTGTRYSIAILSDPSSWMNEHIPTLLIHWLNAGHRVLWAHDKAQLQAGDFCFMLGCGQIVPSDTLARYRNCLVVHESDLPRGRGWSPLTWQILGGETKVPVTLLEAAEKVDSGAIYAQELLAFDGHELVDELRAAVGRAALGLCTRFVDRYPSILDQAREQDGTATYLPRRAPEDSRLDPLRPIDSQLDLLRVVDNQRYPAFFESRGHRYVLNILKSE